jgi:hypothetical protein
MSELNMRYFEELRDRINERLGELRTPYRDLQARESPWLYGALGEVPSDVMFICENPSITGVRQAHVDTIDGRAPDIEAQWWGGRNNPAAKRFRPVLRQVGLKTNRPDARGGWRCYITNVVKEANVAGLRRINWVSCSTRRAVGFPSITSSSIVLSPRLHFMRLLLSICTALLLVGCVADGSSPADEDASSAERLSFTPEQVQAAQTVMGTMHELAEITEHDGDLSVKFNDYGGPRVDEETQLQVVQSIANADVVLTGRPRTIRFYRADGRQIGQADPTNGIRLFPRGITIGTSADTVLAMRGKASQITRLGSDEHGLLVAWRYPDATYVMGLRTSPEGINAYRVVEMR